MCIKPSFTQFHPAPSSSIQLCFVHPPIHLPSIHHPSIRLQAYRHHCGLARPDLQDMRGGRDDSQNSTYTSTYTSTYLHFHLPSWAAGVVGGKVGGSVDRGRKRRGEESDDETGCLLGMLGCHVGNLGCWEVEVGVFDVE